MAAFVIASRAASTSAVSGTRIARVRELDADAVEVLDVSRCGRERRDEGGAVVAQRPRAVEPASQLPLLAPGQRGDATRLTRVTLDERERLQHRVVDAGSDVGALVRPDARGALGIALEREPPQQRPADKQQSARHGAGGEQPRGCVSVLQQQNRAEPRKRDAAVRERRVGSKASTLAQRERETGRDQHDSEHAALGDAQSAQQERAGQDEEEDRPARAIRGRPDPQCEVEHDAGAAREREQREDEPDERDVHAEGLRDSRADPGEGTPFSTRGEGAQRHP